MMSVPRMYASMYVNILMTQVVLQKCGKGRAPRYRSVDRPVMQRLGLEATIDVLESPEMTAVLEDAASAVWVTGIPPEGHLSICHAIALFEYSVVS